MTIDEERYKGYECGMKRNVGQMMDEWKKITENLHGKKPLDVIDGFFKYFQSKDIFLRYDGDNWVDEDLRNKEVKAVEELDPSLIEEIEGLEIKDPDEIILHFLKIIGKYKIGMRSKHRHISDEQYKEMLDKIEVIVNKDGFRPDYYDSTEIGDKYTISNCGLCADNVLVTLENTTFPRDYLVRGRNSMRDREKHHQCPFDYRKISESDWNGCFYTCCFFQKGLHDVDKIKHLVQARIEQFKARE